jgi:hypothetical protein
MCAASFSATIVGSGTVRRDRVVFGSTRARSAFKLVLDARRAAEKVDVLHPQRQQLADAQPEAGLRVDHRPGALGHRLG